MRSRKSQYFQCFVVDYVLILHPFGEGGTVEQRRESGNPPARAARSPTSRSPAGGRRRGTTRDRASGHGKGGARRARDGRHAARAGDDVAGFGFASTLPGEGAEFGARGSGLGARSSEFGVRGSELGARSRSAGPVRGARTRRIVGGVGWGGVGRGGARGRSAPRSAAVNGAMRRYLAVPRRYWMVFIRRCRPAGPARRGVTRIRRPCSAPPRVIRPSAAPSPACP